MTKQEIIRETVDFYSADTSRRAVQDSGACVYNASNGRHCAVGRCMLEEYRSQGEALDVWDSVTVCNLASALEKQTVDDVLEERYRGHHSSFWASLQTLHDSSHFWDKEGLTRLGLIYVENLLVNYN